MMGILNVESLSFKYNLPLLEGIDFTVNQGSMVALLGINGAGKSTLLKCVNRILKAHKGKISLSGNNINEMSLNQLSRQIAYVAQYSEVTHTTVFDTILIGRKPHMKGKVNSKDLNVVENLIKKMNLENFSLRYIDELSGGELQKVMIARALAQEPKLLILDEPTSNLDMKNQIDVLDFIKDACEKSNVCALVSMHDINLAIRYANKYILMKDGKIYEKGFVSEISEESVKAVYNIDVNIYNIDNRRIVVPK
ncbi:ABC transporter ATP-binding protein [Eubacteriales bacterium KG127]